MAPNPRRLDARLDALYAELPELRCQGLCHDSCGNIEMSLRERERIERAAGRRVECAAGASCSMLTEDRRCGVYAIRPMVCRLWGLVRRMRCPYGCVPEGGFLSDAEGMRFMVRAGEIGGDIGPAARARLMRRTLRELDAAGLFEERARIASELLVERPSLAGREGALPPTAIERRDGRG